MEQEKRSDIGEICSDKSGKLSSKRIGGFACLGTFIFLTVLVGFGTLSTEINNIIATGLSGSFALLGVSSFSKHG